MQCFRAAQSFERALLQHAQQLALRRRGKRCNFIEHNGSATAKLKSSQLAFHRASERTSLMPEQFTFYKLWWKTRAINLQKWRIPPRTQLMNHPRQVILARSAFSGNQQRARRRCHFLRQFKNALRRRVRRNPRQPLRCHFEIASPGACEPPTATFREPRCELP